MTRYEFAVWITRTMIIERRYLRSGKWYNGMIARNKEHHDAFTALRREFAPKLSALGMQIKAQSTMVTTETHKEAATL